jgi:GNAT superfamily N-acetyltransferase
MASECEVAMNLTMKTEYWDDPKALGAFKEFMVKIFGLDFSEWESGGYWDNAYTPFSFFKGETIVASVCIYLLDAVIDGETTHLAQISGVGTLPEWRRKGLNRQLTDVGLDWAQDRHDGVFLFANTDAIPFYRKCGFRPIGEYVEIVEATPVPNCGGAVKLDPGRKHELDRIYEYAKRRTPVSDKFSVLNAKLVVFHALHSLRNHVYEIPDLDCVVFYERKEGCLSVFDIVGERVPRLKELYPYIAGENDSVIEVHFFTDKLGLDESRTRPLLGNNPFTKGTFPVERPVFPFTSRA